MDGYRRRRKPATKTPRKRRAVWRTLALAVLFIAFASAGLLGGMVAAYSRNLPDISRMADYQPPSATRIFARDGTRLADVYDQDRVWVPLSKIPPIVREAFVANEDHNFYYHHGVDFGGIARAAFADLLHQHLQGASTITQQLARGLFLNDEVSITRKIQEALLAMEIERYYTKDEILERYLNLIYLGSQAYGVDAAAHTYFGRSVDKLALAQAAMLAGVVAAPSDYSPLTNLTLARERQRHVLDRMVSSGYVTQAQADEAYSGPLGLMPERSSGIAGYVDPYFTTFAVDQLDKYFGDRAVKEGGLQVYTTVDPHLEDIAQEAVTWGVKAAVAEGINAHEGALVAIRPSTGEIVAMVGGKGFTLDNQFNRAWQARRQPGSSFKAYVYTAAIASGLQPTTVIDDSPVSYPMGDGTRWSPTDDDLRFLGPVTLRRALALSRNVVAVKLADRVGIDQVIDYAHRMGIQSQLEANLSLALGTSVVTVLDQASGYATLANDGIRIEPYALKLVKDSLGNVVLDNRIPQQTDAVSAGTAFIITSMLEDVIAYGTGTNANIGRPAAGKTGTTSDFRDAWFVGFTPDLVAAVWIGNDDNSRMNESYGGNIPARIWARFMKAALAGVPPHDFVMPQNEVRRIGGCGAPVDYVLAQFASPSPCDQSGTFTPIPAADTSLVPSSPSPSPAASATVAPSATPPPNSAGDGQNFVTLDASPAAASPPAASPPPRPRAR